MAYSKSIEIRKSFVGNVPFCATCAENAQMSRPLSDSTAAVRLWELSRAGDFRAAVQSARDILSNQSPEPGDRVELHLVIAYCAMRQGHHSEAMHALDAAAHAAVDGAQLLRVDVWRAELAYFQGRYSAANEIFDRVQTQLEKGNDWMYAAIALRLRIAILLARADYDAVAPLADRAIAAAEASGDDYVMVQVLNILGAVRFDCATSKLPQPHARSHLSALDPHDTILMEEDAREALHLFEEARTVAERSGHEFAAWYVAGNIERLEILLGHAERVLPAIRRRLKILQARGAQYDEIVARSNLAWALRTLGRHREALHELDVALTLSRKTGTSNVLLEFLHYDRSVVLYALGDPAGAGASYRRYVQLVGRSNTGPQALSGGGTTAAKCPLEPYFLKRADRFITEHGGEEVTMLQLAEHCGVSSRTLQKAFIDFRGITAVAHMRNMRLDRAHQALANGGTSVAEVAVKCGFRSATTFALEYRKRYGTPPSHRKRNRQA